MTEEVGPEHRLTIAELRELLIASVERTLAELTTTAMSETRSATQRLLNAGASWAAETPIRHLAAMLRTTDDPMQLDGEALLAKVIQCGSETDLDFIEAVADLEVFGEDVLTEVPGLVWPTSLPPRLRHPGTTRSVAVVSWTSNAGSKLVDALLRHADASLDADDPPFTKCSFRAKDAALVHEGRLIHLLELAGDVLEATSLDRVLGTMDGVILAVDPSAPMIPASVFELCAALERDLVPTVALIGDATYPEQETLVLDTIFDAIVSLEGTDEQLDFGVNRISSDPLTQSAAEGLTAVLEWCSRCPRSSGADPGADDALLVTRVELGADLIVHGLVTAGKLRIGDLVMDAASAGAVQAETRIAEIRVKRGRTTRSVEVAMAGDMVALLGPNAAPGSILSSGSTPAPASAVLPPPPALVNAQIFVPPSVPTDEAIPERMRLATLLKWWCEGIDITSFEENDAGFRIWARDVSGLAQAVRTLVRPGAVVSVGAPAAEPPMAGGGQPIERVRMNVPDALLDVALSLVSERSDGLEDLRPLAAGWTRVSADFGAEGLIGFEVDFHALTAGEGVMDRRTRKPAEKVRGSRPARDGLVIAQTGGPAGGARLAELAKNAVMLIGAGEAVRPGMVLAVANGSSNVWVDVVDTAAPDAAEVHRQGERKVPANVWRPSLEEALSFIREGEVLEVGIERIRMFVNHRRRIDGRQMEDDRSRRAA